MDTEENPWNKIYAEAHEIAIDDYNESRESVRRVDDKINRYLVILSIALVPSVNLFLYFMANRQEAFFYQPYSSSLLFLLFLALFGLISYSLYICIHTLKYTEVEDVMIFNLIKSYYERCNSEGKEIDHLDYYSYIIERYATATAYNKGTAESKIIKTKPLTLTVYAIFFVFALIVFITII